MSSLPSFPTKCLAFHGPMLYEAKPLRIFDPDENKTYTRQPGSDKQQISDGPPDDLPKELLELTASGGDSTPASANSSTSANGESVSDSTSAGKLSKKKLIYFVHYKGWKSTWDEWVLDERVLAWNEENLRTQKELKQMALAQASSKKKFVHLDVDGPIAGGGGGSLGSESGPDSPAPVHDQAYMGEPRSERKKRDSNARDGFSSSARASKRTRTAAMADKETDFLRHQEVSLYVPEPLKSLLVDDWEFVTKEHQVCNHLSYFMFCSTFVISILQFIDYKHNNTNNFCVFRLSRYLEILLLLMLWMLMPRQRRREHLDLLRLKFLTK